MTSDQFWSIFTMPIGLLLCFSPVVIAWLIAESKAKAKASSGNKQRGAR
jgi:hypothetical protein